MKKAQIVLEILRNSSSSDMCGLDIVSKSKGKIKRGDVYYVLNDLISEGLVSENRVEMMGGPTIALPRRYYKATQQGMSHVI